VDGVPLSISLFYFAFFNGDTFISSYPLIFIPNWPICQLKISQTGTKVPFPKNLVKPQKGQGLNYCIHILLVDNVAQKLPPTPQNKKMTMYTVVFS
jgi:hypothetical protein